MSCGSSKTHTSFIKGYKRVAVTHCVESIISDEQLRMPDSKVEQSPKTHFL